MFETIFSTLNICYLTIISSVLAIIFIYDLRYYIIPDKIVFPAIVVSILFNLFFDLHNKNFSHSLSGLFAAILAGSFFLILFLFSRGRWIGFGDVKFALLMGVFLGFPKILIALFLAYFIGAIIGLGLIVLRIKSLKSEIPFGPFLVIGTFIAMFFGDSLINWYLILF